MFLPLSPSLSHSGHGLSLSVLERKAEALGYTLEPTGAEVDKLRARARRLGLALQPLTPADTPSAASYEPHTTLSVPATALAAPATTSSAQSLGQVAAAAASAGTAPAPVMHVTRTESGGAVHWYQQQTCSQRCSASGAIHVSNVYRSCVWQSVIE